MRSGAAMVFAACVLLLCGCGGKKPAPESVSVPDTGASAAVVTSETPTPTPIPTPTPTSTPAPTPTPVTDAILASGAFDAYFDDALFLGDSITRDFHRYVIDRKGAEEAFLGEAMYLYAAGYNLRPALDSSLVYWPLTYRGKTVSITEGINQVAPRKVFLMLGLEDLKLFDADCVEERYDAVLDLLKESCPTVELFVVQAITPVTQNFCIEHGVTVEDWNAFNVRLEALCAQKQFVFLDVASPMRDGQGYLSKDLTYDRANHLNADANALWAHELRKFAMQQTDTGGAAYIPVWPTPESTPAAESTDSEQP